jgi:hypothetical protein
MRNGDYFCTSVNELIIGMVNAGNNASGYTLTTSGFTSTTALVPTTGSDEAAGAYLITPTSGSYSIGWTTGTAKKDATAIMVFQQNGNTSGGDQQYLFWG